MKFPSLKIVPLLFGLILAGLSFGSLPNVAQACTQLFGPTSYCSDYYGQYGIPSNYTVGTVNYTYNSCTFDITLVGTYGGCTAPPVPTAFLTQSDDSTVSGTSYTISWGSMNATSCVVNATGPNGVESISNATSGGPLTLTTAVVGSYVATNACTGAGGTASASITHTVILLSIPSTPTVSVTPNPVVSNQDISVSWTTSTGATRYEYRTDVSATPVSMDGFTNPWRGSSQGFVVGDHKIFVRGCNSSTNCGGWGSGDFTVISASATPTITSFTANPKGFSAGTGGPVTLSWITTNADSCTITGGGLNVTGLGSNSSRSVPNVRSTSTYTLTCSGPGGTTTQ